MKTKALDFLKNPPAKIGDRFNEAMELAREAGLDVQKLQRYNRKGATQDNVEGIIYDLQKHLGISKAEISKHDVAVPEPETQPEADGPQLRTAETLSEVQKDPFWNVLREMNDQEKTGLRFDEQYPFLREKDTPDEFKILTADALTAFHDYKKAHEKLFDELVNVAEPKLTNEEVFTIASQLLEDFEVNREIHAELEHYQKNKQILGEHEIFADLKLEREVAAIAPEKLGQTKANIASNISKKRKALEASKDKEEKAELQSQIELLEKKRSLVEARIKPEGADEQK